MVGYVGLSNHILPFLFLLHFDFDYSCIMGHK
jgi:hypothetical protein